MTHLLRCIAGLIKPDEGRIELDGEVLFDRKRHIFVPPHKRRIGMVFQEPRLFPHWSVLKNLYVSHDLSEILQLSDQIVLMKNGRIADHRPLAEILQHQEMRELIHEKDLNHIIGNPVEEHAQTGN